jgi:phosphoacetylglucosamine mutase
MQNHLVEAIQNRYKNHPFKLSSKLAYGTAGFRTRADVLDSVMFTVGILGALRSLYTHGTIGIMVTASHNEVHDNGVKVVDPTGEMLSQEWEEYATRLANAKDSTQLIDEVNHVIEVFKIQMDKNVSVNVGYDNRPHSESLTASVIDGIQCFENAQVVNYGLVTTPQLHYMVYLNNQSHNAQLSNYYSNLANAYELLIGENAVHRSLTVDAAFGIGSTAIEEFKKHLKSINFSVINSSLSDSYEPSLLNNGCGAEHVQKQKTYPRNFDKSNKNAIASVDGDADRVVYFYVGSNDELQLIDGDKIATIFAQFIDEQLRIAGIENLELGIVQTAYANGASTAYLRQHVKHPENIACVATGVKHLHHKAKEFDIAIYFEANGHGTVLFGPKARTTIDQVYEQQQQQPDSDKKKAIIRLKATLSLINPAVGDAISDILFTEAILQYYQWSYQQWNNLYHDLQSIMTKVYVKDRTLIKTTSDETKVVVPEGLQDQIDTLVKQGARTFVRPSGTEDCVRVYAESATQEEAEQLAQQVEVVIKKFL